MSKTTDFTDYTDSDNFGQTGFDKKEFLFKNSNPKGKTKP